MLIAPRFCPFDAAALVPSRSHRPRARCERCRYAIVFADGVWIRDDADGIDGWRLWALGLAGSFAITFLLTLLHLTLGWP